MKRVLPAACTALLLIAAWASAADVALTEVPTAVRDGQKVTVRFKVSRAADVAVTIADARGHVVRHLAAGVLGRNAPSPLKPDSLAQELVWDGNDDLGKPAAGGPFTARVAVGLQPRLKQIIGSNPADLGGVRALAVAPDGNLYVIHCYGAQHPNDGSAACAVFDRSGRYLRTILPFSAALPDDKLAGVRRITRDDGVRVPYVYQLETRSYLPGLGDLPCQRAIATGDGRLAFVGVAEGPRPFAQPGEARLTVVNTDGSVPRGGVLGTLIHSLTDTAASLALSPDEKTLFATGVRVGLHANGPSQDFVCDVCDHGGSTWSHTVPTPYVYTFRWGEPQGRLFVGGQRSDAGGTENRLVEPVSVAVGGDGLVYVADVAADQVVVFDTDERDAGKLVRRIDIKSPHRVEVNRKTGAIYVLAGERELELVKLDGHKDARVVARIPISRNERGIWPTRRPIIALDDRADPAIIWVGQPLMRIEDLGNKFGEPLDLRTPERMGEPAFAAIMEMSVDRVHGWLYVNNARRMALASGQWENFRTEGGRMWPNSNPGSPTGAAGRDGNYYLDIGARKARVYRYGPDLKLIPFPDTTDPEKEGRLAGYARNRGVGLTADARGNVYVLWKKAADVLQEGDFHKSASLFVYGPDGKLTRELLVDSQSPSIYSPRVDLAGNVYLAVGLRPGTRLIVPGLEGQAPDSPEDPDAVNRVNSYPLIYGSIVKFPPQGGAIRENTGGQVCNLGPGLPIQVKGASWIVPGVSVAGSLAAPKRSLGTIISCVCEYPVIDVDDFGRSYFPDAARARVGVLDTAGNPIGWFGVYGNPDSVGKAGTADIPLWWPQAVAVSETDAFVGDRLNRRIVQVKLDYAAEASCPLP